MKVNNILTMMGSGVVLGLTGGILIISSAALGLNAAIPALPQWAAFLIVGVVTAGAGGFLLSRSGTETSKKIEKVERKFTLQEAWNRKPWIMLGISVGTGFVAQRILRSILASDSRHDTVLHDSELHDDREVRQEREERKKDKHSNFKDFLMKPFVDLTRHAVTRAISLGTQMVVTPLLMKKLQEYMDEHNLNFAQSQEREPSPNGSSRDDYSQPQANGNRRF